MNLLARVNKKYWGVSFYSPNQPDGEMSFAHYQSTGHLRKDFKKAKMLDASYRKQMKRMTDSWRKPNFFYNLEDWFSLLDLQSEAYPIGSPFVPCGTDSYCKVKYITHHRFFGFMVLDYLCGEKNQCHSFDGCGFPELDAQLEFAEILAIRHGRSIWDEIIELNARDPDWRSKLPAKPLAAPP